MKNPYHVVQILTIGLLLSVAPGLAQDLSDELQDRQRADVLATSPGYQVRNPEAPIASTLNSQSYSKGAQTPAFATTIGPAWANVSPEMARSKNKINDLVKQLNAAKDTTEKEDIKSNLKEALEEQYDLYLAQHEAPLKELEAKLEKLREEFEWRKSARDDLVKLRLDTIWFDSQGLLWPTQGPRAYSSGSVFQPARQFGGQNLSYPGSSSFGQAPSPNQIPAPVRPTPISPPRDNQSR